MQCCNIYDSFTQFQDGFNYEQARLEEDAVMQQKYKVLSFAIVAALYIFLVPSTSHAQTHVPNTLAGDKACGGAAWTLGCDRIPLNGQPATSEVCERLEMTKPAYWSHTTYSIIQATGGYCYYYKDGKSSGRGGPNMWRYDAKSAVPSSHTTTSCSKKSNAARRSNTYLDESGAKCIPSKMTYCGNIRDATTAQRCFDRCLANNTCR